MDVQISDGKNADETTPLIDSRLLWAVREVLENSSGKRIGRRAQLRLHASFRSRCRQDAHEQVKVIRACMATDDKATGTTAFAHLQQSMRDGHLDCCDIGLTDEEYFTMLGAYELSKYEDMIPTKSVA